MRFAFRLLTCFLITTLTCGASIAQAPFVVQKPPERLSPLNQFSFGAEYSNDSSHIILGQSFNRRLAGLDSTWSRRVGRYNGIAYMWDIELRPAVFLQDPVASSSSSFYLNGTSNGQVTIPAAPVQRLCSNLTSSFSFPVGAPNPGTETINVSRTCGTRWTYGGGLSPVGQRLNFLPRHTLQPYLLANGGFLVTTRDEPVNDSSKFNFTFTFGAGFQYFRPSGTAWSFDYRVQHLSNKKIGDNNPGVDSQVFRIGYTVTGLHRRHP